MHPTFSIVIFTTASGAGFALLFLIGIGVPLGLMPGLLLLDFVVRFWARPIRIPLLTLLVIAAAWVLKEAYWRLIDTTTAPSTVASATALGSRGRVRILESPHTQDNYLLQE